MDGQPWEKIKIISPREEGFLWLALYSTHKSQRKNATELLLKLKNKLSRPSLAILLRNGPKEYRKKVANLLLRQRLTKSELKLITDYCPCFELKVERRLKAKELITLPKWF